MFRQSVARRSAMGMLMIVGGLVAATPVLAQQDQDDERSGAGWFVPSDTFAKHFYVGAKGGMDDTDFPSSNQDGSVTGVSDDDTDMGWGAFIGYQPIDYIAIEGGYREMGDSDFQGQSSGGDSWAAGPVRAVNEAEGWELGILGRWPLMDRWYALGYVGVFWWDSEETFYEGSYVSSETESGSDGTVALGVEYDIGVGDRIVLRFMGEHHRFDDSGYNVNSALAEIVYRFP